MNLQQKKVIGFDLGYTLVYNQREKAYMDYLQEKGVNRVQTEVEEAYHLADKVFMRDYPGVLSQHPDTFFTWYIGVVNYYLGCQFNLREQTDFLRQTKRDKDNFWTLYPWTKHVLNTLKEKGYQLALISNWDLGCGDLLKSLGIYDVFDFIYISSELSISKPNAGMFQPLLDDAECEAADILYIGDNYYDDVLGSRKLGIDCLLINRYGSKGITEIKDAYVIESTEVLLDLCKLKETRNEMNHA